VSNLKDQPMSGKTISIAGPRGLRIPASVLGKAAPGTADLVVPPHESIEVPEAYGRHLIEDRFAYEAEPEGKAEGKKSKGGSKPGDPAKELAKLSRDELLARSAEASVSVTPEMTEAEIIAALLK
jgi:hypothetical protein